MADTNFTPDGLDDEMDLADELADLHADPVFVTASQAEMDDLDDAVADLYATDDDDLDE